MKKTKTIPVFKSERDEAKFWQTHSITDFPDQMREVKNVRFPRPRKRLISLRVDDATIDSLKEVAAHKGIGHLTLIRLWIVERLKRENRTIAPRHP